MRSNAGSLRCLSILIALTLLVPVLAVGRPHPSAAAGVVTECTEASLRAALAGGGSISFSCTGTIPLSSQLEVTQDTSIDGGGVVTFDGGLQTRLIHVARGAHLTLHGVTLTRGDAHAPFGGALLNEGQATITASTLSKSQAANGGAISNQEGASLTITASTLSENKANSGGAIYNDSDASLVITASTLSGNDARSGGGAILNQKDAILTMTASTLSGNSAGVGGGAIGNFGRVTVTASTLANNRSPTGGTIYNDRGVFRLTASIISGRSWSECKGSILSGGYNVANDFIYCLLIETGDLDGVDPELGPLTNNGGPTLTHLPLSDSPALGRVPHQLCAELSAGNQGLDQRGGVRPVGDAPCDSGAVEVAATAWCGWKTGRFPDPPAQSGWEC